MNVRRIGTSLSVLLLCVALPAQGQSLSELRERLGRSGQDDSGQAAQTAQEAGTTGDLAQGEIADGLRAALADGATAAVNQLGRTDGFWGDSATRIPLPGVIQRAEPLLRSAGQGGKVDEFHLGINRAAERAVPVAADLIGESIRSISLEDARQLLAGGDDAATRYFQRTAGPRLREAFLPLVAEVTDSTGVTSQYKGLASGLAGSDRLGALGSRFGGQDQTDALDLDGYVADQALERLFDAIAEREHAIRANPLGQSSDLLRRVFGGHLP